MAAGDLNLLKSWNPKLVKNRKKVWETEQELLKEEQNFLQRQKEINKEREIDELLKSSRQNGKDKNTIKKKTGLEWMYNDTIVDEKEDYLLGKRKLDTNVIKVKPSNEKNDLFKKQTNVKKYNYDKDDPMSKIKQHANNNKRKYSKENKIVKPKNKTRKLQKDSKDISNSNLEY